MQLDYRAIQQWIKPGSRVLDLGCGAGELLDYLSREKSIRGLGVDIDAGNITACIRKRVNVIEQDIDKGLANFANNSFDTVLLTQTLQAVQRPDFVLKEMLRVGRECIITFPNFGHWQARAYLFTRGRMPVSKFMPYSWYDTPNIHFCTVRDFEALCKEQNIIILDRQFQAGATGINNGSAKASMLMPNLFATQAIYHVTR